MIELRELDAAVIIRPKLDEDGKWTGNIDMAIASGTMEGLDDDTHAQIMFICYKLSAVIPYCNAHEAFSDVLDTYTTQMLNSMKMDESLKTKPKDIKDLLLKTKDNILTVDFVSPRKERKQ
jgi:hypothetical protein